MADRLEKSVNVAVLVVSIALMGLIAQSYRAALSAKPGANLDAFRVGEDISKMVDVDFGKADRTLVVALKQNCKFCEASIPFYRQILADRRSSRKQFRLITLMPDSDPSAQQFLAANDLQPDEAQTFASEKFLIRGTPTLVLADRQGKVIKSWLGKLSPQREGEVRQQLF